MDFCQFSQNFYSKNGEDGILLEIFNRLQVDIGYACEVGTWDGIHLSNTFNLVKTKNWTSIMIEADEEKFDQLKKTAIEYNKIKPINETVHYLKDKGRSLDSILHDTDIPIEFDLLSIGIDSCDYHIWKALNEFSPKVVVIKHSGLIEYIIQKEGAIHKKDKDGSTSFFPMRILGENKGYTLLCNTGNLIFIRNDYLWLLDNNLKNHLLFWDDDCSIKIMEGWAAQSSQAWKNDIRKEIISQKYTSILDYGAGVFTEYFAFKKMEYPIKYKALEFSNIFVEYGLKNDIDVEKTYSDNLNFQDKEFDCVLCYNVFNHQVNYRDLLIELIRVAKKEVIISFFKPFMEDIIIDELNKEPFKYNFTEYGIVQKRFINKDGNPKLIYNMINRSKLKIILDKLKIDYIIKKDNQTTLLIIRK
tara:strand:+ start:11311 stop:12558 length:1248 start_codon:yes stop_codon:yes gene_type:complete